MLSVLQYVRNDKIIGNKAALPPPSPAAQIFCLCFFFADAYKTVQVVAVGPGRTSASGEVVPMTVATGDLIKFRNFAGSEVSLQGVDYRVMKIGEVLAKW